MIKVYKILSDLCRVITESSNETYAVDKALFTCLYPFTNRAAKFITILDVVEKYYDNMFQQGWTTDTVQNKVINRTKELITKIENCIDNKMCSAYNRREIDMIEEVDTQPTLPHARLAYMSHNCACYFNFESYRKIRAVSTLEEMAEICDFRTKQLLLKLKVIKIFEGIVNIIIKNLIKADIIYNMTPCELWSPVQCLSIFKSIRAYCSKSYMPEHIYLLDDKATILKEYCEKDKQKRAQLLLDNVYNELGLRYLDKQDVCAVIYLLFEKKDKLGFKTGSLCKFNQFKEKIYEYFRLSPSTYKKNQIIERADEYRNKSCILTI